MSTFVTNQKAFKAYNFRMSSRLSSSEVSNLPIELNCSDDQSTWKLEGQIGVFSHGETMGLDTVKSNKKLYVLYGIGDGEFLNRLRQMDSVKHLLVFEPSISLFQDLLRQVDLKELFLDPKVRFIIGEDSRPYIQDVESYFMEDIDRYCQSGHFGNLITPGVQSLKKCQEYYTKFATAFRSAVANMDTHSKFSKEDSFYGLRNVILSYSKLKKVPSIDSLSGMGNLIPAVIVATGPSLTHSLDYLFKIQKKAVIICCDSAFEVLLENKIVPHFVCSLERVSETQRYYDANKEYQTALVVPSVIHSDTINKFNGPLFLMGRDTGFDGWFYPDSQRYCLGQTVSQMCLAVASAVGCSEISLVGVDCCFDPHSGKSHHETADPFLQETTDQVTREGCFEHIQVKGHDGKDKTTWAIWLTDTIEFSRMIQNQQLNVKRILPVEYGIPINGVEQFPPEYFNQYLDFEERDFFSYIQKVIGGKTVSRKEIRTSTLERLIKLKSDSCDVLENMMVFSYENASVFEKMHSKYLEELFPMLDSQRHASVFDAAGIYNGLMHNILQGVFAQTGYALSQAEQSDDDLLILINKKVEIYKLWFGELILWTERVIHLVEKNWEVD